MVEEEDASTLEEEERVGLQWLYNTMLHSMFDQEAQKHVRSGLKTPIAKPSKMYLLCYSALVHHLLNRLISGLRGRGLHGLSFDAPIHHRTHC